MHRSLIRRQRFDLRNRQSLTQATIRNVRYNQQVRRLTSSSTQHRADRLWSVPAPGQRKFRYVELQETHPWCLDGHCSGFAGSSGQHGMPSPSSRPEPAQPILFERRCSVFPSWSRKQTSQRNSGIESRSRRSQSEALVRIIVGIFIEGPGLPRTFAPDLAS